MEYKEVNGKKYLILVRDWKGHPKGEKLAPKVFCPFCNREHQHAADEGHRSAHCMPPIDDVQASDGTILKASDGYWIININKPQ